MRQRTIHGIVVLAVVIGGLTLTSINAQEPDVVADPPAKAVDPQGKRPLVLPPKSRPIADEQPLAYWVEQLGHHHFLRREVATKKLVAAGPEAVTAVIRGLPESDLETVERSMVVISEIALARPPNDDGGAWRELNKLAALSSGVRSTRAEAALNEIRKFRAQQAHGALTNAGVFIGMDDFVVRATSKSELIVQIDEKWRGDVESLHWLRWLQGIEFARVKGPAVRRDVLERLVAAPDLRTLVFVDCSVDEKTLEPLMQMPRINSLEFRYVKLTHNVCDAITKLPIRVSLNLMGTGVSLDKVESMRELLPGLTIDHKQGGFLGVTCFDSFDVCQISGIIAGSAAEAAGLIQGDVIVKIGDSDVRRFRDLQNAINQHLPGDEIEVKFLRGAKVSSVTLHLRRLEDK